MARPSHRYINKRVNRPVRTWGLEVLSEPVAGGILLAPRGRIGSVTAAAFARALQTALTSARVVAIDLGGVDYLSGAGLRVLEQSGEADAGRTILFGAQDAVQITLELSGLAGRFRLAQSKEEALEALAQ
jgi:anti-sigma B factor antagonist